MFFQGIQLSWHRTPSPDAVVKHGCTERPARGLSVHPCFTTASGDGVQFQESYIPWKNCVIWRERSPITQDSELTQYVVMS